MGKNKFHILWSYALEFEEAKYLRYLIRSQNGVAYVYNWVLNNEYDKTWESINNLNGLGGDQLSLLIVCSMSMTIWQYDSNEY